jgi:vitamin-K-epoxide reductase (warfarin-sensitive)
MRSFLVFLALAGILVSSLALSIHYSATESTDQQPFSRSVWNSSAVGHSPYSVVDGIPVAALGIAGYALVGLLAFYRRREFTAISSLLGLAYALYLTNIEARILDLWCVECVPHVDDTDRLSGLRRAHRQPSRPGAQGDINREV